MKLESYTSGVYRQQYKYKSFSPTLIDQEWTWNDPSINTLLESATMALAELNAFSTIVPDVDLFIQMHAFKEASSSSRIEGTTTTMNEELMDKEFVSPEKRDDWQEVRNYLEALNWAVERLRDMPLSNRLLRDTHRILLQGVRGEQRTPGEFRRSQNWIGGTNLQTAVFIPPHHGEIAELMGDLEKFWHDEQIQVPHLVRIAMSHYQFETIHPFQDGNGRIGRLLITLYLVSTGMLTKPSLYLSDYFERHRGAYYDALTTVRASNNMVHWVKLFLDAIRDTASKGKRTFQEILALQSDVQPQVSTLGRRAGNGFRLLEFLYGKAVVTITAAADELGITHQTAAALIRDFERLGILVETTGRQRNRVYVFEPYLQIFID
jgi:Fic family protein